MIEIDKATLNSWEHDDPANAEVSLTITISASQNPIHHALACRALVRAHLHKWDAALADAKKVFAS